MTMEQLEMYSKPMVNGTKVDPAAGVTYAWHNLNVYAPSKGLIKKSEEFHILKNVSGMCEGGQLLAIMGASGAGKTTLLNVLTFRSKKLRIEGDIHINGRPVNLRTIAGVSAYVQQEDLFTGVFTVKEQLMFNAQLRIGKEVSEKERKQRVHEVMRELGLNKCADTRIGIPGRVKGISGGEKKRLAFACEVSIKFTKHGP
ncbi:ATPase activity protein [Halocaridina rubra]|uniref:ATPase activity protein n=1 Tax=Halocaridina rubra TaxID=373956 RepID=A0AAN8XKW9_HALRR